MSTSPRSTTDSSPEVATASERSRRALGVTVVALLLALVAGALPFFGGASADTTRPLIRVSFRPAGKSPVGTYVSDNGAAFDSRRAFGWVRDNNRNTPISMADNTVSRSRSANPRRTATFIAMQPRNKAWGRWLLTVEPGTYRVTVTAGDPSGVAGGQTLAVEGERVIDNFRPTAAHPLTTKTVDVEVTDGRLTLDPLYPNRSTATKLVSVDVRQVLGDDTPPTTEPPVTEPPVTEPPTTEPPVTEPPTTEPPVTQPPVTQPPSGQSSQVGFAGGGKFLSYTDAEIKRELDGMAAAGGTWLRIGFLWSSIEQSPGVYYWNKLDQVVGWANERGIKILANVAYTPDWARPADCRDMMCPPANVDNYARFMGKLVEHFAPMGVHSYEVWNEPNQYFWWAPKPQPARYADMLKKAYNAGHAADSHVTIVAGALAMSRDNESGTTMNPRTFLAGMYAAGATGHFDALSFHPYTGTNDARTVAYWSPMTGVGPDLAAMMAANGDAGTKIWATEFAYSTCSCSTGLSESEAASLLRIGLQTWRSQSYAGPLFHFTYRDMGTDRSSRAENFGLVKRDFTPKQGFAAMRDELTT